jgi:hypothetical protein
MSSSFSLRTFAALREELRGAGMPHAKVAKDAKEEDKPNNKKELAGNHTQGVGKIPQTTWS